MSSSQELRLLFIGRPTRVKGLADLLYALTMLVSEAWLLTVVGGVFHDNEIADLLGTLGPQRVVLRGSLPNSSIPEVIRCSDLLVVPSRYETFGNVALEAMACGRPVVAAFVGGLKETVQHGVTGFHFPPGDAVRLASILGFALDHQEQLRQMGLASQKAARRYSWQKIGAETLALFNSMLTPRL